MTYIDLALWFTGAAAVISAALWFAGRAGRPHAGAIATTIAALVLLTALFDTLMIATGLFHYSPDHLLGIRIGLAPLEDFAYPIAGAILLPTLWSVLRSRRRRTRSEEGS